VNEETNALIARFYLGKTTARDFADWAVSCLEQNLDTKNIRILSAMFNVDSHSEIDDYFQRALEDLNWKFPRKEECLKKYAEFIARQILDKKIEPATGCGIIHTIYYALEYPDYFLNWNILFWNYEDALAEEIDFEVIREAERLISGNPTIFPPAVEEKPFLSDIREEDNFLVRLWRRIF
jgi:hypothetical protein